MALVSLAIKLAPKIGTPVFPSFGFLAPRFIGVPLAIRIVRANDLIDFVEAWNAGFVFASESEAGAGEQYDKGRKSGEVLHISLLPSGLPNTSCTRHGLTE
jgi:hypothetical protein